MARDVLEVIIGTGTLLIAPVGEPFPTNPTTAAAGNWEDPGYSIEGWTFVVDRTYEDVVVAELIDPIRVLKTAQTISMRGTAAQNSLENLLVSFGGGGIAAATPGVGFRTYTPPVSDDFSEFAVLFRAEAPPGDGSKLRDFKIPRTIAVSATEIPHGKAPAIQGIALEMRALVPSTGSIFSIVEQE